MKNNLKKVIIVGGGTAGAVVAKNLVSKFDVTIIDKSFNIRMPLLYRIPLMIGLLFKSDTKYIQKITLPFIFNRDITFYHSNLIGGASIINGCVHVLGSSNLWKIILSNFESSFDDFKNSYHSLFTKGKEKRKIRLTIAKKKWLDDIFFATLKKRGIEQGDVERTDAAVSGMVFNTVKRFLRSSVLDFKPFSHSKIIDGCQIERLVINRNSEVIGVFDGKKIFLADYIFLCAGVIGSNTLLLQQALQIHDNILVDLGLDAGQRIKDHTNLRINVKAKKNIDSLNEINDNFFKKIKILIKHTFGIWTLMRGTGATATANVDINGDGEVDARINFLRFYETGRMGGGGQLFASNLPGFSLSITQINPESCGRILITSSNVKVMPGYLSEFSDIEFLKNALKFVIQLLETEPLCDLVEGIENIELIKNFPKKYIVENTYSGYHLIGGCSHLLGGNFEVRNFKNLYVCDASALSLYPSSNIHSSVLLLADICSKKFLKNFN